MHCNFSNFLKVTGFDLASFTQGNNLFRICYVHISSSLFITIALTTPIRVNGILQFIRTCIWSCTFRLCCDLNAKCPLMQLRIWFPDGVIEWGLGYLELDHCYRHDSKTQCCMAWFYFLFTVSWLPVQCGHPVLPPAPMTSHLRRNISPKTGSHNKHFLP